jgi:dephospho-CoA kinase
MSNPYKVGLTGGIGSGKSLVSKMFADLGVPVIDADDIAHELIKPGSPLIDNIINILGKDIIDSSGMLDRDKLRSLIFSDSESKEKLEAIMHPHVFDTINRKISEISAPYCILSIPLLVETNARDMVDAVLVVDCPVSLQIERVSRRDGVTSEDVQKIIQLQASRDSRILAADDVINNEGTIAELQQAVTALHEKYTQIADGKNI